MNKEKIKKIMAEVFELKESQINDNISQQNTVEWDSLNHLNLIVEVEEKFSISFTPEQIGSMTSLNLIIIELEKVKK